MVQFNSDLPSAQNELRLNYSPQLLSYAAPSWGAVALISFDKSLKSPGTNVSIHLHSDYSAGVHRSPLPLPTHTHTCTHTATAVHWHCWNKTWTPTQHWLSTASNMFYFRSHASMHTVTSCSFWLQCTMYVDNMILCIANPLTWAMVSSGNMLHEFDPPFTQLVVSWIHQLHL